MQYTFRHCLLVFCRLRICTLKRWQSNMCMNLSTKIEWLYTICLKLKVMCFVACFPSASVATMVQIMNVRIYGFQLFVVGTKLLIYIYAHMSSSSRKSWLNLCFKFGNCFTTKLQCNAFFLKQQFNSNKIIVINYINAE